MAPTTVTERGDRSEMVRFTDVCDRLGIHRNTGYHLLHEDRFPIPVERVGGLFKCRAVDVEAFFAQRNGSRG